MATRHRSHHCMYAVWVSLLVALVLSACGTPPSIPAAPGTPSDAPAPSASPSPAPSTPATDTQPTAQPTVATEPNKPPTPQSAALAYFWPTTLPAGLEIRPARSSADTSSFILELGNTNDKSTAMLVGGKTTPAGERPTNAGQQAEVIVRGIKGMAYQTGSGYSVYWEEQGTPYAIIGSLSLDQITAITDALQSVDLATWQTKLSQVNADHSTNPPLDPTPPPQLDAVPYLWPHNIPEGLAIDPAASSADARGFALSFRSASSTEPIAALVGGKASPAGQPPTNAGQQAEVIVRGIKGMAYQTGSGYSVYWEEQGTPYAIIGSLSLDQITAITDALQSVDLTTWQMKLAEVK